MTALALQDPPADERRLHVVQGEYFVSDDPRTVLTTILGSCVTACLRDPVAGVGGMNHFLLPGDRESDGLRYGVNAMELLVNALLQRGARRGRLEAKLFGGARVVQGLSDVGRQNASFAQGYLEDERIIYLGGSLGGDQARRIQFWPTSGRVRQLFLSAEAAGVVEEVPVIGPVPASDDDGVVELF
jgi:chemotaxis protein CheD